MRHKFTLYCSIGLLLFMAGCGPSSEEIATMTASAWTPTPPPTATITSTSTWTPVPPPTATTAPTLTIVGKWEKHGEVQDRAITEHFNLNPDGTYSIEATYDDTGERLTSTVGTYVFDETTLTLTDSKQNTFHQTYSLDATGTILVATNKNDIRFEWRRVE